MHMRVTTGNNPYIHQQQRTNDKDKGFADMLCRACHSKTGNKTPEDIERRPHMDNRWLHSIHRRHVTIPPEGAENTESCLKMGKLTLMVFESDVKPVKIEPIPPTYPKSIYDMSVEELRSALTKGAMYATSGAALGMKADETYSREEIYNRIKSVYANYLGEDFLDPKYNYNYLDEEKGNLYNRALHEFHNELKSYGVHDLTFHEIRSLPSQDFGTIDRYPTSKYPARPMYPQRFDDIAPMYLWDALDSVSFATKGIDKDLPKEEIYNRIQDIYFSYFGKDVFDEYLALNKEDRNYYNLQTSIFMAFHRDLQRYDVHNLGEGNVLALDSYGYDVLRDEMNL